ncbi:LysR family transcriptional regulator [Shimia marina]|uniref:D-malate degradation protein R n=1 Tax=Shimia marina TaxID=321267 RepID=A0A0P1EST1_9RHOB|nr:LysR family transcriptional regulator [Shimia marina]CUH53624.1 D-malate degradation protein R [Shimia marina]SFD72635.1 transcriptional regulator, LysR family [Shimia marina]
MDRLGLLETLISALSAGSLSGAGLRRGISQSAVSQQLRQLETHLGQQLLHRSSQGVTGTRAGILVQEHAQKLLERYELMLAELEALDQDVSGKIRISAGNFLGRVVFGPVLLELGKVHPDLDIILRLDDRMVDVVREGYDLAIRAGKLGDTAGFGRKIASLETVFFASPTYLEAHGRPESPEDLMHLKFIQHREEKSGGQFILHKSGVAHEVPVRIGFTADDPEIILNAVRTGMGYTRAARLLIQKELEVGIYEEILPRFIAPRKDVFALSPTKTVPGSKVDLVINAFVDKLATLSAGLEEIEANAKMTA